MSHPLIRRLENHVVLTEAEKAALLAAPSAIRTFAPREDIIREGQPPDTVKLLLTGFAARHKTLPDGRRQVTSYLVPGDFCDLHVQVLRRMDHSIGAVTAVTVAFLEEQTVLDLSAGLPRLARALAWARLVDEAVAREWIVSIGQRTALERTAHLFCELFHRLQAVELTRGARCELPMTQTELGEAMGLSAVHVNRTLQELRREELITLEDRELKILDLPRLEAVAMFDPTYLHLQGPFEDSGGASEAPGEASAAR